MSRKRVVVFISGGGSNMEKLIEASKAKDYPAEIVAVFSDNANAGGLAKAKSRGVETFGFERASFASKQAHEDAILQQLDALAPDIICLAGYMRIISANFIKPYEGKILNIHPSLLPLFPGLHTHQRAIEAGVKIAGCSVHIVTEGMDEGPILAQAVVPVLATDNADSLSARVLKQEHQLYPQTLRNFIEKKSNITDEKQFIISFG
ncbi:phosphoribosylglycinamide formyltransferase [Bartonella sp. HY329]|uniref:phosphoribosylglycinamide formyltransferase n=1 Tax=unclassified Bartonella TaxID=2645622 RepID=UPI0021C766FE|nr:MULTISPECIES: phosphoribosylglycinamide formyltransferase [unclassified Bartonella]UXM96296.1 phosphoribosylglycinamide formyltransferase [Bartonella sp. HY329]UXN10620.1 phosphoribosylglycinamide formyltransferase [Bartonella sp. HY328]